MHVLKIQLLQELHHQEQAGKEFHGLELAIE
jgi:hypothetical protein